MSAWRRVLASLGIVVAGFALSGCHMQGTLDIVSTDEVSLDVLVTGEDISCSDADQASVFTQEPARTSAGAVACHITGTVKFSEVGLSGASVMDVGEYRVLAVTLPDDRSWWPDGELEVRFPGDVVRANQGVVAGNVVRINPSAIALTQFQVVALNRPGPPSWVLGVLAGLAGGVAASLAVVFGRRLLRRRHPVAAPDEPAATALPDEPAATAEEQLAPALAEELATPADTSWFAHPPAQPPRGERPAAGVPDRRPEPDHSVWAPPEEPADRGPID